MRFVSCEKATRTKLCKKSEVYKSNYAHLSAFIASVESQPSLKSALLTAGLGDKYAQDMKDLGEKKYDYRHSEKVVYSNMARDLQINFNRVNNSIEGLVEKLQYY